MGTAQDTETGAGPAFAIILGGCLAIIGLALLALVLGLPREWVVPGALALSALGYLGIALASRSRLVMDHLVAGREMSPGLNGLATTAQWMSGVVFFGLAAVLYDMGHDALALVLGWSAGFVLIAVLIAPYLHKSGALTVPDFLGRRYGGVMPRLLGVLVLISVTAGMLLAQIRVGAVLIERSVAPVLPEAGYATGLWVVTGLAFLTVLAGGMRSVSWTQIAQGALILAGFLVPAAWLTWQTAGMPVPQLALGEFLGMASNAEAALGIDTGHAAPFTLSGPADPVGSEWDFLALAATVMLGTAAMPVLLQRSLTTPTVSGARSSAGWALLFIVLLLITVPTYALFARAELFTLFAEAGGTLAYDALPAWLLGWPEGVLTICGRSAADAAAVQGACGAERAAGVTLADIGFAPEFLVLAAPEMAGLSSLATVLILLGGLAAVLSSVSGQLLAISSSVAHDVGFRIVDREMSAGARVALGRIMALAVAALAGFAALDRGTGIAEVVGWTLSLAAGGLFAPIVLGIWDRRTTGPGAAAGIVAGYGLALLYIAAASIGPDGVVQSGDEVSWLGLHASAAGLIGAAGSLVVTWLVSRVTPAPGPDTEDFIEEMRVPRDHAIAPIN